MDRERQFHSAWMNVAEEMAKLSTCAKRRVGAVAVRDRRLLTTGFNGAPAGAPHCVDVGCLLDDRGKCVRCTHAEANVVAEAAARGLTLAGATVYCTLCPCRECAALMANAGVHRVVWLGVSGAGHAGVVTLKACGIEVYHYNDLFKEGA